MAFGKWAKYFYSSILKDGSKKKVCLLFLQVLFKMLKSSPINDKHWIVLFFHILNEVNICWLTYIEDNNWQIGNVICSLDINWNREIVDMTSLHSLSQVYDLYEKVLLQV